jgi:hypothetical protein
VPAFLIAGYLVAAAAGPEAYSRFRLAIVPLASVLAAGGAVSIFDRLAARRSPGKKPGT